MPAPLLKPVPAADVAPRRPTTRRRRGQGPDRAVQDLWVTRLKARDADTLREVVDAFGERVTAVVSGILRDQDAVKDVVQETFSKVWYRIDSFKGGSSLYTWIYRIAVNGTKDYIKSRKRRPASSLEDLRTTVAVMPSGQTPMLEGLERRELRLRVRRAIDRLPMKFRAVLSLREIDGMAYHDIAETLGLSLGTVESRLFRARKKLRVLLEQDLAAERAPAGETAEEETR